MVFYFARHGETKWNVDKKIQGTTDVPLNEKGIRQAEELANKLVTEGYRIDCAYTSPQRRAAETARIAAKALGIECIPLEELIEMNLGEWEGSNWNIIEEQYGEFYRHWNANRRYVKTPGGESYNEVLGRTLKALSHILEWEKGNVLVVTHSAVLMALRCYLAKCPFGETEMVVYFKIHNAQVVEIAEEAVREAIERYERGE